MENFEQRQEELEMLVKKIQESGLQFPDIRDRDWMKLDSKAAQVLNLLIEAENILTELDEYQMENGNCYPDIEDIALEFGLLRKKYTDFVDENKEVLMINSK